jgi:type I restriction enzyme S subunit
MKAGWQRLTLGDVCHVYQPETISQKQMQEGEYPVYGANGVIGRHNQFNHEDPQLILGCRGSCGTVHTTPARSWINGNAMVVKPREDIIDESFLSYALRGGIDIGSAITGAAQPQITRASLIPIPILLPKSLPEQERIVGILDEAFDGIAKAKATAEANLQNARALFQSHLQTVFSQQGEGWVEKTLGEVYDVRDGTHDSPKYHATGFPLITSKNLKPEGLSLADVKLISEGDYNKINERSAVHRGDVLFAMIGTIGNPTLVDVEPRFAIKNVALFKVPSGQSSRFLKHYLDSEQVKSKMAKEAKGTTQKFVGLGYLRSFPISLPPPEKQSQIALQLDGFASETQRLESLYQNKLNAFDELKKSLLHQAFTGNL